LGHFFYLGLQFFLYSDEVSKLSLQPSHLHIFQLLVFLVKLGLSLCDPFKSLHIRLLSLVIILTVKSFL
jgi:hypothetical protein